MPTPVEVIVPVAVLGVGAGYLLNSLARWLPRRGDVGDRWAGTVRRPFLELATGLLFAATAARFGLSWLLPAYLSFAALTVVLTVIDIQHRLLPNAIVYPGFGIAAGLLTVATIGGGQPRWLLRAALAAIVVFGFFLVSALIAPSSVGMGDVKLAAVVGLYLGYLGWNVVLAGVLAGFVLAAVLGLALILARRATRRTLVPFGPSMLVGAAIAIAWAAPVTDSYLAMQRLG